MVGTHSPAAVLDAWPLVRHYDGNEPAASRVRDLLHRSGGTRPVISSVNLAEVGYTLANLYGATAAQQASRDLLGLMRVEAPDSRSAQAAAWIKHAYKMSLGDAFAVATALRHGVELWTGDPELLCPDRVWTVRDLRRPEDLSIPEPGRRTSHLTHLDREQLAAFVAAPFGSHM